MIPHQRTGSLYGGPGLKPVSSVFKITQEIVHFNFKTVYSLLYKKVYDCLIQIAATGDC